MTHDVRGRALVLGGGGVTGIAWMIGVLTGLQREGVDLTDADTVIGTSAGSVVGAQLTSGQRLEDLYAGQLEVADRAIGGQLGLTFLLQMGARIVLPGSARTRRRRLGRGALRAHPGSAEHRVEVIRQGIGIDEWPERDLRVTAVDARTGRFLVLDRDAGVPVEYAVAASCSVPFVWPPVEWDGTRYIDGGMRSAANVDLATGAERVVVLAPLVRAFSKDTRPERQLARTGATHTALVSPDRDALVAIGKNVLDADRRGGAAQAGLRQSADVLDEVRRAWG
ncbi:patatin-like phospholipase family protein [Nocardioides sp. LHG3406-4]|uniref:patatin-like phospholipase family protein n=1 Tax=Nocardioides sp. LHG3406-4 TaxID=2804575 RepID=UPI003CFBC2B5